MAREPVPMRKSLIVGGKTAPPDKQGGPLEKLREAFERGLVSAEMNLTGSWSGKTATGTVGAKAISTGERQRAREIINEFQGEATMHAPYDAMSLSDPLSLGRRRSMMVLKDTVDYCKDVGVKKITVHPTDQFGAAFIDPFTNSMQNVPKDYYLAKNRKELKDKYFKMYGIEENSLLARQIEDEWKNFAAVQADQMNKAYAASRPQVVQEFVRNMSHFKPMEIIEQSRREGDPENITKIKLQNFLLGLKKSDHPEVRGWAEQLLPPDLDQRARIDEIYNKSKAELDEKKKNNPGFDPAQPVERVWAETALVTGGAVGKDGNLVQSWRKDEESLDARTSNFLNAMARDRFVDFDSYDPKTGKTNRKVTEDGRLTTHGRQLEYMKESLKELLNDPEARKEIVEGDIELLLENLYASNPKANNFSGSVGFNTADKMIDAIKTARNVVEEVKRENAGDPWARKLNPNKVIGITFDTQHALVGAGRPVIDPKTGEPVRDKNGNVVYKDGVDPKTGVAALPSDYLKKLKEAGIDVSHVHFAGGKAAMHAEGAAIGAPADDIWKMDPDLWAMLNDPDVVRKDAVIMAEVDGEALDSELQTMWNKGVPPERLVEAFGKGAPEQMVATTYGASPNFYQAATYFGSVAMSNPGLANATMYSFNEQNVAPGMNQFGSLASPGMYTGGLMHRDIAQMPSTWKSYQPFTYSAENK